MKYIVMLPWVKALATNRVVASCLIGALWFIAMGLAFLPGVAIISLLAFAHPMICIAWHKAYRKARTQMVERKKLALVHAA